jgi:hypothetical protein
MDVILRDHLRQVELETLGGIASVQHEVALSPGPNGSLVRSGSTRESWAFKWTLLLWEKVP